MILVIREERVRNVVMIVVSSRVASRRSDNNCISSGKRSNCNNNSKR